MASRTIRFMGVNLKYPKGIRKSPGANWVSICVGEKMAGKEFGSRAAVKQALIEANHACTGKGGTRKVHA